MGNIVTMLLKIPVYILCIHFGGSVGLSFGGNSYDIAHNTAVATLVVVSTVDIVFSFFNRKED